MPQASKQASIHTHGRNAVTLMWGSLMLAPISSGAKLMHKEAIVLSNAVAFGRFACMYQFSCFLVVHSTSSSTSGLMY